MGGKKPKRKHEYPWYLGGCAASGAACLTHPLDVSKVRMQTSSSRSMLGTLVESVKRDGLRRGAYAGLSASLMRQMTYSLTRFAVYDKIKVALSKPSDLDGAIPVWKLATSASVAGAAGGLTGNPADIILVRMIGDANRTPEKQLRYKNCFDGLFRMVRDEGSRSMLRGLAPNCTRAVIMNVSQLATYDTLKGVLMKTGMFEDGMALHFSSSFAAGTIATTVCAPFDVLKSRIMNASGQSNILQIVHESFKTEGPMWMFRGWMPAWVRLLPNTIAIFLLLEQMKMFIDRHREYEDGV